MRGATILRTEAAVALFLCLFLGAESAPARGGRSATQYAKLGWEDLCIPVPDGWYLLKTADGYALIEEDGSAYCLLYFFREDKSEDDEESAEDRLQQVLRMRYREFLIDERRRETATPRQIGGNKSCTRVLRGHEFPGDGCVALASTATEDNVATTLVVIGQWRNPGLEEEVIEILRDISRESMHPDAQSLDDMYLGIHKKDRAVAVMDGKNRSLVQGVLDASLKADDDAGFLSAIRRDHRFAGLPVPMLKAIKENCSVLHTLGERRCRLESIEPALSKLRDPLTHKRGIRLRVGKKTKECTSCGGRGWKSERDGFRILCTNCDGFGTTIIHEETVKCDVCSGKGYVYKTMFNSDRKRRKCMNCNGKGKFIKKYGTDLKRFFRMPDAEMAQELENNLDELEALKKRVEQQIVEALELYRTGEIPAEAPPLYEKE